MRNFAIVSGVTPRPVRYSRARAAPGLFNCASKYCVAASWISIKLSQAFGQGEPGDIWFKMQSTHDFWHASSAKRKKVRPIKMKMVKAA